MDVFTASRKRHWLKFTFQSPKSKRKQKTNKQKQFIAGQNNIQDVIVLCVNLTGWRDDQINGKTLLLGVSMGVFPEEISIWISRWGKTITLTNAGGHHAIHRGPDRTKRWGCANLIFFVLSWNIHLLLPWTWVLLILRSLDSDWITPPAFLVLQLADSWSWDLVSSIIPWANSCNRSPHLYVFFWFCFSGKPWLKCGGGGLNCQDFWVTHFQNQVEM